ncbi:MAG: flagellar export protein FliJ [Clostridiales bacterium]|nr:flagellar export protein FliJ [Clostridiales bacterium]
MAKFIYRMQNILDIKYKLEEQAKQEYMTVQARLNEEKERLQDLEDRKAAYFTQYRILLQERLDILEIETCKNAIILMDEYIHNQQLVVARVEKELEQAIRKMNEAMQERKIHEKLREKQWETFLQELSQEEMKEIDQLISYQYNHGQEQEE